MNVKEYLKENRLLFDGSMGTYFTSLHPYCKENVELVSLTHPNWIKEIHENYIKAGSNAIKTNTFCCNRTYISDETVLSDCISTSYDLASQYPAYVFCDIGPVSSEWKSYEEYKWVVDQFLNKGAQYFLFETLSNPIGLNEISSYIKSKNKEAYIICSFSIQSDGYTKEGIHIQDIISSLNKDKIDAIGLNCGCGVHHMHEILKEIGSFIQFISPNAGYPTVVNNRTQYQLDPDYFATEMISMMQKGIKMAGGCCGIMPSHIQALYNKIKQTSLIQSDFKNKKNIVKNSELSESDFFKKLKNHQKVIAVELDPPSNWDLSKFMKGAWQLKEYVDALTIADCPIGRARMDASLLACKVKQECKLDVLPHMTCRDRNLNATKALLLADYAQGIRDVLLITGDPIPSSEKDEVKTVYQHNSRKLASYITSLEQKGLMSHFNLFGALNINAVNFDIQLKLAKEKIQNGMVGLFTQPVLSKEALYNLKRAREELDVYIMGGIIPVVSYRNAIFMENEINGIHVCDQIIDLYKDLDRMQSETQAIKISGTIMKEIEYYVDGFYLMTPFGRSELMVKIIDFYKQL